jgi:hypothetical protein
VSIPTQGEGSTLPEATPPPPSSPPPLLVAAVRLARAATHYASAEAELVAATHSLERARRHPALSGGQLCEVLGLATSARVRRLDANAKVLALGVDAERAEQLHGEVRTADWAAAGEGGAQ